MKAKWSASLFYCYTTIVPLCLFLVLKYYSTPSGLIQLFFLYGYSLIGVAGFMSSTFLTLTLKHHITSASKRWFFIVATIFLLKLTLETCSCFGTEHLLIQRHSIAMKLLKYVQGQFEQIILITDKGHCSSYQLDCNYVWSLERNCIHSFLTIYNISSTLIWISRV